MILIPQRGSKDCIQTKHGKKSSSECEGVQIISWGLFWGCRQLPIPLSDIKFEPLCSLKKIVFKYCVGVVSYGTVGNHFPRIVFSLVKQKVSRVQEQEQVFVTMEFTVQVITFC